MIAQSVAGLLADHVRLTVEGIDRMYLNVYVPRLQCAYGAVSFFRASRAAVGLLGPDEPDEPALCGGARPLYRAASASRRIVSQRPAQRRCDGDAPT